MAKSKQRTVKVVTLVLLSAVLVAVLGLFAWQTFTEGYSSSNLIRALIIAVGVIISMIRLIGGIGGGRKSRRFYADFYPEELKNAFVRDGQKAARNDLLEGIRLFNEDKCEKAIERIEKALKGAERPDDFAAAYLFIGLSYTDLKNSDRAIDAYRSLLRYKEKHARGWTNLGKLYVERGDHESGIEAYRRAIECDPSYAIGYNNLSQVLLQSARYAEAIPYAEKALELDTGLAAAANALAISHYGVGNREESRRYVELAVRLGSDRSTLETIFLRMDNGIPIFGGAVQIPAEVEHALDIFRRENARPMVSVCLPANEIGIRSRVGGSSVGEAPIGRNGKPMRFLAAIWCSEVHGVPDFPERGILRFYLEDNGECGVPPKTPSINDGFCVLYTEDEATFGKSEFAPFEYIPVKKKGGYPVEGCYPVRCEPMIGTPLVSNHCFDGAMNAALQKAGAPTLDNLPEGVVSKIIRKNSWGGHRIGGYPCFEQGDPRSEEEYRKYDTLLFQLVSHGDEHTNIISFGNEGGCQFFIEREKLRAKNFSEILYYWDDVAE